jgi:cytochrome c oxidase cbb3-type subunit 3
MVKQGEAIFTQNCALCHGPEGKGMISAGAPNLTDDIWLYGGERETVRDTLRYGRAGVMPEWETKLGNERIMLLAAYVYSLSDRSTPNTSNN